MGYNWKSKVNDYKLIQQKGAARILILSHAEQDLHRTCGAIQLQRGLDSFILKTDIICGQNMCQHRLQFHRGEETTRTNKALLENMPSLQQQVFTGEQRTMHVCRGQRERGSYQGLPYHI